MLTEWRDKRESQSEAESSDSSLEESKNLKSKADSKHTRLEAGLKGRFSCRLECFLQDLVDTFPRCHLLFSAHLQLDSIGTNTQWSIIWQALKLIGPESRLSDEKAFKRLNVNSNFPQDYWDASVYRLWDSFKTNLALLKMQDNFRTYSKQLPRIERKAFSACIQIWRKTDHINVKEDNTSLALHSRLSTSLEATVLCRQDDEARIVVCLTGNLIDSSLLRKRLDTIASLLNQGQRWQSIELCADSSLQVRGALEIILQRYNQFQIITLSKHDAGTPNHGTKQILPLPPILLQSKTIKLIHNTVEQDNDENHFMESDYRNVMEQIAKSRNWDKVLIQPPKMAKLSTMCCLVARENNLNLSELPLHLQGSSSTAGRCISCARIMTKSYTSPDFTTGKFREQASLAGFKVRRHIIDDTIASLSAGNAYLPPLSEYFEILETSCRWGNKISIGGASTYWHKSDPNDNNMNWQFCAFCSVLHFGLQRPSKDRLCNCPACYGERRKMQDPLHLLQWRRHRRYSTNRIWEALQDVGWTLNAV